MGGVGEGNGFLEGEGTKPLQGEEEWECKDSSPEGDGRGREHLRATAADKPRVKRSRTRLERNAGLDHRRAPRRVRALYLSQRGATTPSTFVLHLP